MSEHDDDPAAGPAGEADAELLDALAGVAARADPPPADVLAAARAALALRTLDAELVALVRDSAADGSQLAGVRGPAGSRLLSFGLDPASEDLHVEMEVAPQADGRRLVGQVRAGGEDAVVELETAFGRRTLATDRLGRFAEEVPAGPLRLRLRLQSRLLVTEWVLV